MTQVRGPVRGPLSPGDFDELHEFIRLHVAAGFLTVDDVVDDAVEVFTDATTDLQALHDAARVLAERAISGQLAAQAAWPEVTDNDRLDAAFAELETAGIVARQHFSCCGTCGATEIHDEMDQVAADGGTPRGYTFFHVQDTESAVEGEPLYLSFGSREQRDRDAAVAIGHEVVATLARHGLAAAWNGRHAHRIELPLTWQRRR